VELLAASRYPHDPTHQREGRPSVGLGRVASAASQANTGRRTHAHGQRSIAAQQARQSKHTSLFSFVPTARSPLSRRDRDLATPRPRGRDPPPPPLAGDGRLRQLGRHRLEPNRGTVRLPLSSRCPCSAPHAPPLATLAVALPRCLRGDSRSISARRLPRGGWGWGAEFSTVGGPTPPAACVAGRGRTGW
jgi:hypothetical protein